MRGGEGGGVASYSYVRAARDCTKPFVHTAVEKQIRSINENKFTIQDASMCGAVMDGGENNSNNSST
jgi:hypothetical protein